MMQPDFARNMKLLGHSDQGGRSDGIQVMVSGGYAYVGHLFSCGFSVIDVRDPRKPKFVRHIAQPEGTWSQHLQTYGDLLIVNNMKDVMRDPEMNSGSYYKGSIGGKFDLEAPSHAAGIRMYDIADRANPKEIAFCSVPGLGVHRTFYDGGDYVYASALPPGFSDDIFLIIDIREPSKAEVISKLWIPGMNTAAGETPSWNAEKHRYALHHAIVKGDLACGAWRDGGVTLMDVSNRHAPTILAHDNPCPPFAGGTHNTLPLPGRGLMFVVEEAVFDNCEDGIKRNWVYDISVPTNPVSISTTPLPSEADYATKGGQFGPHNLHENRSEGFQSEELIFVSYQNAGVRVYDIADPFRPKEVAALVPPAPKTLMDYRPNKSLVVDSTDVFVDKNGLIYVTDWNGGLTIMELERV